MLDRIRAFVNRNVIGRADHPFPGLPQPPGHPARGVELAACALLLELAHADGEFSAPERAHIEQALGRHFGMEDRLVGELIELAESERRQSIDHFQFTRLIAREYDLGQKLVLAEVMWGVILADGKLGNHETYLVRKLGHLLELEPGFLSQARAQAAATNAAEGRDK